MFTDMRTCYLAPGVFAWSRICHLFADIFLVLCACQRHTGKNTAVGH